MPTPQTTLHYAPNANLVGNTYAPGADGFNLADVGSVNQVNVRRRASKDWYGLAIPAATPQTFKR